jgi:hypothetical protein
MSDPTFTIETITPAKARKYLEANTGNFRPRDQARVKRYAGEMSAGEWELNGESIKFSVNGELLDGQHRLLAVVEANSPIRMAVTRNIAAEAKYLDRGKPRSVSQWIQHTGIKNANTIASISRGCVAHEKGLWKSKSWAADVILDSEVIDFAVEHHQRINDTFSHKTHIKGIPNSTIGAILFIGSGMQGATKSETVRWFRDRLAGGAELSETDPVFHLRNRLAVATQQNAIPNIMKRYLATIAWNKTVRGEAMPTGCGLRIRMTGPAKMSPPDKVLIADDVIYS